MFCGFFGLFEPLIRLVNVLPGKGVMSGETLREPAGLSDRKVGGNIAAMCPICLVSLRKAAKAKGHGGGE